MKRLSLGLCLLFFAACGEEETPPGSQCEVSSCTSSAGCPLGDICEDHCCVEFPGCTPGSCDAGEFCDEDFFCKDIAAKCNEVGVGAGGCQCAILNSAGQLEAEGSPRIVIAGEGERELQAVLVIDQGTQLPGATFTFTPTSGTGFTIENGNVVTGDNTAGTGVVTATANGTVPAVTCTADIENLGPAPTGGEVRVYAFDSVTGDPVTGVELVFTDAAGDEIGNRNNPSQTTDADGLGESSATVGVAYNVTAFKAGFNYLSVVGITSDTKDLALPMTRRNDPPTVGGFTGVLDTAHYEKLRGGSDATAAIVAGSVPLASILNFDLETFVGSVGNVACPAETNCNDTQPAGCYCIAADDVPGGFLSDDVSVNLPGGLILGFGETLLKGTFDSVGIPGRRYAWGIGGGISVTDVGPLIEVFAPLLTGGECACDDSPTACDPAASGPGVCSCDIACVDVGKVFDGIVPLLSRLATAAKGNIPLKEVPQATWEDYIGDPVDERVDAAGNFPLLDSGTGNYGPLELREFLSKFSNYTAPALPEDSVQDPDIAGTEAMEGMLVLTGVNATGFGFVPLGLGAALDCTQGGGACLDRAGHTSAFDGQVNGAKVCAWSSDASLNRCDDIPGLPNSSSNEGRIENGHLGLFRSPAHSGLEGQEFMTVVVALPLSSFLTSTETIRVSGYVLHDHEPPATGTLPNNFMEFANMPANGFSRTYTVGAGGGDLHWVTVASPEGDTGPNSTRWNIYFPSGGGSFEAPSVPATFVDPFAAAPAGQDDIPEGFINATHVAFELGSSPPSLSSLVANEGMTLTDVSSFFSAFTVQSRDLDALP